VAAIGAPFSMAVDAVSYLASGLLLSTITRPEPEPQFKPRSLRVELEEGLHYVYWHPILRSYALTLHARFLFASVMSTVFTLFVLRGLDPGMSPAYAAFGLGAVFAIGGVGAVVGNAFSGKAAHWGVGRLIVGERLAELVGWMLAASHRAPRRARGDASGDPARPAAVAVANRSEPLPSAPII
jgi:hypothetical protein